MKNIALYMIFAAALLIAACNKDVRVTGVIIEPRDVVLSDGESVVLKATVTPDNAKEQTVYWFTENPDKLTVENDGRITCVKGWLLDGGYVTIYAMTKESLYEDECRVWYVPGGTLELSESELIMSVGGKHTLSAFILEFVPIHQTVTWSGNAPVTWSSSTPHIATVNATTGEVTAVSRGYAFITAATHDGGRTAVCRVLVEE